MKIAIRYWPWIACLMTIGVISAARLVAQAQPAPVDAGTQVPYNVATTNAEPPNAQEAADSAQLINAVNGGDFQTALQILHNYGIADSTLHVMAANMSQSPAVVELGEQFLKATLGAPPQSEPSLRTNFANVIQALGYQTPICFLRRPSTKAITEYDSDFAQCPAAPIMVFDVQMGDTCFIRNFELYGRYADYLHSIVLNGPSLSNAKLDETNYPQANLTLKAMFLLVKARKPNAFVWLSVVKQDNHSDEKWLRAMTFRPDGLQISNLRQFHSPFVETRARYEFIVGTNMPMMVAGFEGYSTAMRQQAQVLKNALQKNNMEVAAAAQAQLGGIGAAVGQDLSQEETNLQSLGYCGLSVQWPLLAALANTNNAAPINKSNLVNPRAGLLDIYYGQKDYAHVLSFAANMISNSAPGDLDWTVGNLYEGIALLSQTPPDVNDAIPALNRILAFNYSNLPGRDHYIIGAVTWRIQAAKLSGDTQTPVQLIQWVKDQPLREDLKSNFLRRHGDHPTSATSQ